VGEGRQEQLAVSMILSISEATVKFHIKNILTKLDASTRAQAVASAMQRATSSSAASSREPIRRDSCWAVSAVKSCRKRGAVPPGRSVFSLFAQQQTISVLPSLHLPAERDFVMKNMIPLTVCMLIAFLLPRAAVAQQTVPESFRPYFEGSVGLGYIHATGGIAQVWTDGGEAELSFLYQFSPSLVSRPPVSLALRGLPI